MWAGLASAKSVITAVIFKEQWSLGCIFISILVALWTSELEKNRIYNKGRYVAFISEGNVPGPGFKTGQLGDPLTITRGPGRNYFQHVSETLYLFPKPEDESFHVWNPKVLDFRLHVANATSLNQDDTLLVYSLSRVLKLPIRIIQTWTTSSLNRVYQIQIGSESLDDCDEIIESLIRVAKHGHLDIILNQTVQSLHFTNQSVLPSHYKFNKFLDRRKRSRATPSPYLRPYKLSVCCLPNKIAIQQPLRITVQIRDQRRKLVTEHDRWAVTVKMFTWDPIRGNASSLNGQTETEVIKGIAKFVKLEFVTIGSNYRIMFKLVDLNHPKMVEIGSKFVSPSITVTERPFELSSASNSSPYKIRTGEILMPYPGVILRDKLTKAPLDSKALRNVSWMGTLSLKYDSRIYNGELKGVLNRRNIGNQIIFTKSYITNWGLQFILAVNVTTEPPSSKHYYHEIGPFNVGQNHVQSKALVYFSSILYIELVIDSNFNEVMHELEKFKIYLLNFLSRKYSKVRWTILNIREGSIVVNSKILGAQKQLADTARSIVNAVDKKALNLNYLSGKRWRVKRATATDPKGKKQSASLEQAAATTKKQENEGSVPLAWIAAIVINGVLVFFFIVFVVYCYCRSKKRAQPPAQQQPYNGFSKPYEGNSFSDKKQGRLPGTDRAAFIRNGGAENHGVFSVENERSRLQNEDFEPDRYSTPVERNSSRREEYEKGSPFKSYYGGPIKEAEPEEIKPTVRAGVQGELDDELEAHFAQRHSGYDSQYGRYTPDAMGDEPPPGPGTYKSPKRVASPPHSEPPPAFATPPPEESPERTASRESLYPNDPMHLPAATAIIPDSDHNQQDLTKEAWQQPVKSKANVAPVEEPIKMFDIFLVSEDGSNAMRKGQVPLMAGMPMTLTHLRSALKNSTDMGVRTLAQKEYKFLTEDSRPIELPEGALLVENLYTTNQIYIQKKDHDWQAPKKRKNAFENPEPQTLTYGLYKYRSDRGVKEILGTISIPDIPTTLTHLRSIINKDIELKKALKKEYLFMTEQMDDVSAPEGALLVNLLYPNQDVVVRFVGDSSNNSISSNRSHPVLPPPKIADSKKKELAYVGPMGMCSASECEKPSRLKCLDCGQVGYCTTRHMRDDLPVHRKVCFKPQWRN